MSKPIFDSLARNLNLWHKVLSDRNCDFVDVENDLSMSVEFYDTNQGMWIWTCQAVVGDIDEDSIDPMELLMRNNDDLVWCYYVVKAFEEGGADRLSLNLKYSFATPAGDQNFAHGLLVNVLKNMRKFALATRG